MAAGRFLIQLMIGESTREKLQHARNLLGHQIPSGDLSQVLDRALDTLIDRLEKQKLAATSRPRRPGRQSANPRHVPAHVRRAVWERDRGQCTFTSPTGHRCPARSRLEFDHVTEVARGGAATFANLRLRCRAHNQHGAECAFGAGFMDRKRVEARRRAEAQARAAASEELIAPLRLLGFSPEEVRRAAATCEAIAGAPLEQRLRHALACLRPRAARVTPILASAP